MKTTFRLLLLLFFTVSSSFAQNEWYVSPAGTSTGDGSIANPWDLQTALNHPGSVAPGDTIWLRDGQYDGRFTSSLEGTPTNYITVASFPGEWAILNGNTSGSTAASVLLVTKRNVTYKDFEVTFLGDFPRDATIAGFQRCDGVYHDAGEDCKFINLVIHNNPGVGFSSWKFTGATEIYGCTIYNNGWIQNIEGRYNHGHGLYIQNISDNYRVIKNNIVFNNYDKGAIVWSASESDNTDNPSKREVVDYIKNVHLERNTMFNSASPYYADGVTRKDNMFLGSGHKNDLIVARNITITENTLYHNTDFTFSGTVNQAASLTIGWKEPISRARDITVENNWIVGRNNALRLFEVETISSFKNNLIAGRYVNILYSAYESGYVNPTNWNMNDNLYFTRYNNPAVMTEAPFRVDNPGPDIHFQTWRTQYGLDIDSVWDKINFFQSPEVLDITQNEYNLNTFKIVLFKRNGSDVSVDLSSYGFPIGTPYTIRDVENYHHIAVSDILNASGRVTFPMNLTTLEYPTNNTLAKKTLSNFGVFIIEFDPQNSNIAVSPKVYLQGALQNSIDGLMRDDLRTSNVLPLTSPYADGLTITSEVLTTTGANAIVDWIQVELRDAVNNTTIVANKSALLQRDGDVVGLDGNSPVSFSAPEGNYHIVIKHRNHLAVMSDNVVSLVANMTTLVDFTNSATITYGSNAQTSIVTSSGTMAMWAGDANNDGQISFIGSTSDAGAIKSAVLNHPDNIFGSLSYVYNAYDNADVDLNTVVSFIGAGSETSIIKDNVLNHPGNFFGSQSYSFPEQLPMASNRLFSKDQKTEKSSKSNNFIIAPNPSNGLFTIYVNTSTQINEVTVFDMKGKKVRTNKKTKFENTISVDASNLEKGIYILEIKGDSFEEKKQVIIE